jgi:O-antigen/teichoic acid export membrane protein
MVLVQAGTAVAVSVMGAVLLRPVIGRPAPGAARLLLASGLTLWPAAAATWGLQLADRLFLVNYVTGAELGHYAIANRITGLLYLLTAAVSAAWPPLALALQDEPGARQIYADAARYVLAAMLVAALGLGLFAREIVLVLAHGPYLPAVPYVGALAYVQVFNTAQMLLGAGALASKQLGSISWTVVVGAALNLLLNASLIPAYGLWGATAATVIGFATPPTLLYLAVRRRYPIPYAVKRLLAALLVHIALMAAGLLWAPADWVAGLAWKLGLLALFGLALLLGRLVTRDELRGLWAWAQQRWSRRTRDPGDSAPE